MANPDDPSWLREATDPPTPKIEMKNHWPEQCKKSRVIMSVW